MSRPQLLGASRAMNAAAAILEGGFQVFTPVTDLGADLVACNIQYSKFIPVQVKYKEKDPSLKLDGGEIDKYKDRNLWLVFFVGSEVWSLPFDKWLDRAEAPDRADRARYVGINKNREWLKRFEGFTALLAFLNESEI